MTDHQGRAYTYPSGDHDNPFPTLVGQAYLTGNEDSKQMEALAGWVTPAARDYKGDSAASIERGPHIQAGCRLPGCADLTDLTSAPGTTTSASSPAATARRVVSRLNPAFSLWLMGYPKAWTACSPECSAWDTTERLLAGYYAEQERTDQDV